MINHLPGYPLVSSKFNGQATLLAILIATAVAVVTAVGVTSRQNSSIRRSTYTAQTDQAFSCANSAVDVALLCISNAEQSGNNPLSSCASNNASLSASNCTYSYTVSSITGGTINISTLPKDSVQQFNTSGTTSIDVRWRKSSSDASVPQPAIELTYAYQSGTNYNMDKVAWSYNGAFPSGVSTEGFTSVSNISGGFATTTYNFPGGASNPSLVRIKPLFSDAELTVTINGASVPAQGYRITTQGVAGGTVRNIEVLRMNPQLPAIFDYVLYSEEGSITK